MTRHKNAPQVRELVANFVDSEKLHGAVEELAGAGFNDELIDLLASDDVVNERFSHLYRRVHKDHDTRKGPPVEYVSKDAVGESARSMVGAMAWFGVTLAGGVLLIAAGAIGSPWLAAFAAVPAVGGAVVVMSRKLRQGKAEEFKEQVDHGHILLFVRADSPEREEQASLILRKHSLQDIEILDAPMTFQESGNRKREAGKEKEAQTVDG